MSGIELMALAVRSRTNADPKVTFIILGVVVVAIVLGIVVSSHYEKKRKAAVKATLDPMGFTGDGVIGGLTVAPAAALAPIEKLAGRPEKTTWGVEGSCEGVKMVLMEHEYTTGAGKNRQTHRHSVASVGVARGWPGLELYAENFFHKIGEMFGSHDFKVEDEEFNSRWRVKGDSEDFALLFLTPEVQAMLKTWDKQTSIAVKAGRLCVYRSGHLKAEKWAELIRRAAALRKALPPELDAWSRAAGAEA